MAYLWVAECWSPHPLVSDLLCVGPEDMRWVSSAAILAACIKIQRSVKEPRALAASMPPAGDPLEQRLHTCNGLHLINAAEPVAYAT